MQGDRSRIAWAAPWFAPFRAHGAAIEARWAAGEPLPDLLNAAVAAQPPIALRAGPLRFVPATALPAGEAYEAHIARTACVPTREDLHDFFNALVWLTFPAWKRRLNELQAEAIAGAGIGPRRGALRDALTLFDESGALLDAPAPLTDALRRRDWHALFLDGRPHWSVSTRVTLFGHALLEKLAVAPYKAITAHAWTQRDPLRLQAADFVPRPFEPLPVLGIPGWWAANEAPAFYDDDAVFRPRSAGSPRSTGSARPCRS